MMKTITELYSGNEQSNLSESLIASSASAMTESELRALITGASYGDCLEINAGLVEISSPIAIPFGVSIKFSPFTRIKASNNFSGAYVLTYTGGSAFSNLTVPSPLGGIDNHTNIIFSGGIIDGNGKASCFKCSGFKHITIENMSFHNGKVHGLAIDGDHAYEAVVTNCYAKTFITGCEGNIAFYINKHDCHFTDCIVVDYTIGFKVIGTANKFTRCHVWGGIVGYPDSHPTLDDSINFEIVGGSNQFISCYADTAKIGVKCTGSNNVFVGMDWYNNYSKIGLDNVTYLQCTGSGCKFIGCSMRATAPNTAKVSADSVSIEKIACIGFPS